MNKYILVASALICAAVGKAIHSEGYYWRDYTGIIPVDAYAAGYEYGQPIYIGQVLVGDKIIPGRIYQGETKIYYEWREKAQSATKNIKILCTQNPENMEWVPTSVNDVSTFSGNPINGGYQEGFLTYIGRAYNKQETNVGKVICSLDKCLALYTVNGKTKNAEFHDYEVLTYNSGYYASLMKNRYVVVTAP